MVFAFKTRRSAGVPVTGAVHRILRRGNAARDRRDWAAAAAAYQEALAADPSLAHIWLQLGNMLKEAGQAPVALDAYAKAAELRPGDPEPPLQAARLHVQMGAHGEAGALFLRAFEADPARADAASGLHAALARARGADRDRLLAILRASLQAGPMQDAADDEVPAGSGPAPDLVLDVSDLVAYWGHARLPTGIQRLLIQTVLHALEWTPGRPGGPVALCCFVDGRDDWLPLSPGLFRRTVALAAEGGGRDDPAWIAALHRLHASLAVASPFAFPRGATLVNLGSSWQLHNYFLFVREAKRQFGIRYVPFVHDLIAVVQPQYFTEDARREFVSWVPAMLDHADGILVNSEATRRDLLRVAESLGTPLDPEAVAVVPIDTDSRSSWPALPEAELARWGLQRDGFVLFVATVEPRKGHDVALEAWSLLLARRRGAQGDAHGGAGGGRLPRLVCVGKNGWLSGGVFARLQADPVLAANVLMLQGVGDPGLTLLYDACLFTIYPSLYEGWGSPVTESLCHGRAVVTTTSSSLPEAGGEFAVYVPPGDAVALAGAVERLAFDTAWRTEVQDRIAARFRPRGWNELSAQIDSAVRRMSASASAPRIPAPVARLGAFHPLHRVDILELRPGLGSGETFRTGKGWLAPDFEASRIRPGGAELAIGIPPGAGPLHLAVLLIGPAQGTTRWRMAVEGGAAGSRSGARGTLRAAARKWVTQACPATDSLRLRIWSEPADEAAGAGDGQGEAPGVGGFFVCEAADTEARMRLVEAVALGNLDELAALPEPETAMPQGGADAGLLDA